VFFGPPEFADFRAGFGVPEEWTPIGAIAVGHVDPDANPARPELRSRRKPLTELVHHGRWQPIAPLLAFRPSDITLRPPITSRTSPHGTSAFLSQRIPALSAVLVALTAITADKASC
jgi:hypothetical protein